NQPNDNAGIKENLDVVKVNENDVHVSAHESDKTDKMKHDEKAKRNDKGKSIKENLDVVNDVADDAFEVKVNENDVYVSAHESDKTDKMKHDEKAKRNDKGKSLVDSTTGVRDLRVNLKNFLLTPLTGPSVNVVSLNFGIARQSSFVDPSKYLDDLDKPELEDIVYSDDEEDVGAEADLFNLETNIPVSPILTTRVYKDHLVNQIIGDLNSAPQTYTVSGIQHNSLFSRIVPFPRRLQNFDCDDHDHTLPQKEKEPRSFTLPCFIYNICFDKYFVDLGASVSVMPLSTYTNLSLGILSHTSLTIELADRTLKQPRGIAKNVLVRIGKFVFPIDFIILDIPKDEDVLLILRQQFLSTAHSKIDVFKRKITLRVREEKLVFKSVKLSTSIIKRVFVIKSLNLETKLIGEDDEPFNPTYGNYIELKDLDIPLKLKTNRDYNFEPTFVKTDTYKIKLSCLIGYKYVNASLLPSLPINLMYKSFYDSIIKDNDERRSHARPLVDIPTFIKRFSIFTGFTIIDDDDITKGVMLGMKFCKKYVSCQMFMKKFAHEEGCAKIEDS
nr:hypothetical protein [Tanacetum cinerariifolium]